MLCSRFLLARESAVGEMSTPRISRLGIVGFEGERRECRRRGMQPVPVQRSRMRKGRVEERRERE